MCALADGCCITSTVKCEPLSNTDKFIFLEVTIHLFNAFTALFLSRFSSEGSQLYGDKLSFNTRTNLSLKISAYIVYRNHICLNLFGYCGKSAMMFGREIRSPNFVMMHSIQCCMNYGKSFLTRAR